MRTIGLTLIPITGGSVVMFLSHMTIALLVKQNQSDWPHHSTAAWTAVGYVG